MVRVRTSATFRVATLLRRGSRGLTSLRARVAAPAMCPREPWLPTAARLVDPGLGAEAVHALAGDAVVNMHRALARLTGLIGGPPRYMTASPRIQMLGLYGLGSACIAGSVLPVGKPIPTRP